MYEIGDEVLYSLRDGYIYKGKISEISDRAKTYKVVDAFTSRWVLAEDILDTCGKKIGSYQNDFSESLTRSSLPIFGVKYKHFDDPYGHFKSITVGDEDMTVIPTFEKCHTCSYKSEAEGLCSSCNHNRMVINKFIDEINNVRLLLAQALKPWPDIG